MTVSPFTPGSFATQERSRLFIDFRERALALEKQLATGKRADTYSGFGVERRASLDLRGKMAGIETYSATIMRLDFRLETTITGVESIEKIIADMKAVITQDPDPVSNGVPMAYTLGRDNLDFVASILNLEVGGRYLFAGRDSDNPPMNDPELIVTDLRAVLTGMGPPADTDPATIMAAAEAFFATSSNWQPANADTNPDPRNTLTARIDDGHSVGVGVLANEQPFRGVLVALAALAAANTPGMTDEQRDDLAGRALARMSEPNRQPQEIAVELGLTRATMSAVRDRHETGRSMLQDALGKVENANGEAVAAELLALQTRLEASYRTTATLSRLSLVNFL